MIEEAVIHSMNADIFAVIGTSLQVYPAAGLVQYAPHTADKYIIDKKIPYLSSMPGLTGSEKPATEGIGDLIEELKKDFN